MAMANREQNPWEVTPWDPSAARLTVTGSTIAPNNITTVNTTSGYAYINPGVDATTVSLNGYPMNQSRERTLHEQIAKSIESKYFEESEDKDAVYAYLITDIDYNISINYQAKKIEPGKIYCYDNQSAIDCLSKDELTKQLKYRNNKSFTHIAHKVKDLYSDPNFKVLKIKVLISDIIYVYGTIIRATEFYVVEEMVAAMSISFKVVNVYETTNMTGTYYKMDVEVMNNLTMKNMVIVIDNDSPDITKEKLMDLVERKIDTYFKMCDTLAIEGELI